MNGILYDVLAFDIGLQRVMVKLGLSLAFEETSCCRHCCSKFH